MQRVAVIHRKQTGIERSSPWRATLSGSCGSLVGIGLARFAYTPLLPAIVSAGWFARADAAYLGAANLAGYLVGALLARPMAARAAVPLVPRAMMLLATAAFFACAYPLSLPWFFLWRFAAGMAGGALMVLAAPTVLPHVAQARRGLASGAIFAGVGLGIAASGTLVPLLLQQGLRQAWFGLGILSLVLTAIAWTGWPSHRAATLQKHAEHHPPRPVWLLRTLYAQYGLNAAGLVPHMIFLVDFVARDLGQGLDAGARYWVLFGLGAIVGPIVTGHVADKAGFGATLRLAYLIEAAAVALPLLGLGSEGLIVSSIVVGAFTRGIVPLVLGRVHELLPHDADAREAAWSSATTSFAVAQAASAYGLSFVFAQTDGDDRLLFMFGAAALGLALAVDLITAATVSRGSRRRATD
nr:YbfB/YjiJ family MFS transporter [uncultured Rhodopila sp.]